MASNTGGSFDMGIDRARAKETTNQPAGGPPANVRGGVVKNVTQNPTTGGGISKPTKGAR